MLTLIRRIDEYQQHLGDNGPRDLLGRNQAH
jgi:hypothetical protein